MRGILTVMATPGSLRQSVADALGLSDQLEKIDVHLRNLREAGLIAKAKTGRGAAEMGPGDAANLLIAVAASEFVKDSVKSVERFSALTADPASLSIHGGRQLRDSRRPQPLVDLSEGHTFGAALRQTLALLATDSFFRGNLHPHSGLPRYVREDAEYLFVRFFLPYDAISIVYGSSRRYQVQLLYGSLPVRDVRAAWDLRSIQTNGRLLTIRIVDKVSLRKIAQAVGPIDNPFPTL
jgi:hypothetical protein